MQTPSEGEGVAGWQVALLCLLLLAGAGHLLPHVVPQQGLRDPRRGAESAAAPLAPLTGGGARAPLRPGAPAGRRLFPNGLHHVPDPGDVRGDVGVDARPGVVPHSALRLPEADEAEESVHAAPDSEEPPATVALAAVRVTAARAGLAPSTDLVPGYVPVVARLALRGIHHLHVGYLEDVRVEFGGDIGHTKPRYRDLTPHRGEVPVQ